MMLVYIFLITTQPFFKEWYQQGLSTCSKQSFKEQIQLEVKHHPSIMMRCLLGMILKSLEQGWSLSSLMRHSGMTTERLDLDWNDLQYLFGIVGMSHPKTYPLMNIMRLIGVIFFSQMLFADQTLSLKPALVTSFLFLGLLLSAEISAWLYFKKQLIALFLLSKNPTLGCDLHEGEPQPQCLHSKPLIRLWRHCYTLKKELKTTLELYTYYYEYNTKRRAIRLRTQLTLLIDLCFVIFFLSLIDVNFKQMHSFGVVN